MKAKLIFDLDNEDDVMNYALANKATDFYSAMFDIQLNLKKKVEHEIERLENMGPYEVLDFIFKEINRIIDEHNVDVDLL